MHLVIDSHEKALFDALTPLLSNVSMEPLLLGDILIRETVDKESPSWLLIERKSINDLLSSIKDKRYDEQSLRLSQASEMHLHNIIYLVEGLLPSSFGQNEEIKRKRRVVFSSMVSLQQFKGFSLMRTNSLEETAEWLVYLVQKLQMDFEKKGKRLLYSNLTSTTQADAGVHVPYSEVVHKAKKENFTAENIGAVMLSQIPGISSASATELLSPFNGNIACFIQAATEDPKGVLFEGIMPQSKKKIRKNVAESIYRLMVEPYKTNL